MIVITRQVMKVRVTVHERSEQEGLRGAGRPEGACRLGVIAGHVTLIGALDSSVFVLELPASLVCPAAMSAHLSIACWQSAGCLLVVRVCCVSSRPDA